MRNRASEKCDGSDFRSLRRCVIDDLTKKAVTDAGLEERRRNACRDVGCREWVRKKRNPRGRQCDDTENRLSASNQLEHRWKQYPSLLLGIEAVGKHKAWVEGKAVRHVRQVEVIVDIHRLIVPAISGAIVIVSIVVIAAVVVVATVRLAVTLIGEAISGRAWLIRRTGPLLASRVGGNATADGCNFKFSQSRNYWMCECLNIPLEETPAPISMSGSSIS